MRHVIAILIKLLMVTVVLWVIFGWVYTYPFDQILALSLLVTGISYAVGDLLILPASNNAIATAADIGLSTLAVWLLSPLVFGEFAPFLVALLAAIILAAGEWFFHKYMSNTVLAQGRRTS